MFRANFLVSTGFVLQSLWLSNGFMIMPSAIKPRPHPRNILGEVGNARISHIATSLAAKRKMSMAEKRKRRQSKQRQSPDQLQNRPPSRLDFKSAKSEKSDNDNSPIRVQDPAEAANQAKELLKAQRESVDMLTLVRERVESLPVEEISKSLDSTAGYAIADDFLKDESILTRIYDEGTTMYDGEHMKTDMSNLGSGEYIVSVAGGKEQYALCPRIVELVVSMTKHIPEAMKTINLDASACMATLRIFDHTAFKASLALLTGESDEKAIEQSTRSFGRVVEEGDDDDKRRLSIHYFVLPDAWDESMGGGIEFEAGNVAAKRDRLVIWKSDKTTYRKQPWKGKDQCGLGGCVELHLVEGSEGVLDK